MSVKGFSFDGGATVEKYDYTELDNNPSIPVVDGTLSVSGAAADAKAVGDEIADLKADLSVVESAFEIKEQYLLLADWIPNSRYSANSTSYGTDSNYRRYKPFVIESGKYYYYNIHPYFSNLQFQDGTITNLTSFSGTVQTLNNRHGYFTISESATVYLCTNQMSNSMFSLFEQNPYVYVEGIYYKKLIESVMPFTLDDLSASDIQINNKLLTTILDVPVTNLVVYSEGKLIQSSPSSGNAGWRLPVDVSKLKDNQVELKLDIESITGTGRLYCIGSTSTGTAKFITMSDITVAGIHSYTFDLNAYVVYNDLDINKPIYLSVYNQTNDFRCVYTAVDSYAIITELDVDKNLNDNLNDMLSDISYAKNGVDSLANSKFMIAPNGNSYFVQVSNDGTIHAVETIPTKTLFIGNSLLLGNGTFGMCALDNEHDYYHHISTAITQRKSGATFVKQHGTAYEVAEDSATANAWINTYIAPLMGNDINLVIIQLGDNVNTAQKVNAFRTNCVTLLRYIREHCPNANVVWMGEWYWTSEKQGIIADACAKTGSMFVDISDLNYVGNQGRLGSVIHRTDEITVTYNVDSYTDDATNHILSVTFTVGDTQYSAELPYTSYTANGNTITVTGSYRLVDNTGLSSHPGNDGMLAIANRILNRIGM